MLTPATTFDEIRDTCFTRPLKAAEIDTFFVSTDEARDENSRLGSSLYQLLTAGADNRNILVYGHGGCGKSTELNRFKQTLGADWFIVGLSIQDYLPPIGVKAEDILLAIAVAIFEEAKKADTGLQLDHKLLRDVEAFFSEVTDKDTVEKFANLKVGGGVGVQDGGLWSNLLNLSLYLKSELGVGSRGEHSVISKVRKYQSQLSVALATLVLAAKNAAKSAGRRFLIVVEDLDKLGLEDAESIFLRNGKLLADIPANIIYTIPLFTFYSSEADALRASFDTCIAFPMIKVRNVDGSRARGHDTVREIVRRRVDAGILDDTALDYLITHTGGVLRHVFEVLQTISTFINIENGIITEKYVKAALARLRTQLGRQIGFPRADPRKPDALYERLIEVARKQSQGFLEPARNQEIDVILLKSGSLIEYNGEGWVGVHPMALQYLFALGYTIDGAPAVP